MIEILAYGEDALTLWLLGNKLADFLDSVGDASKPEKCQVLYRPSFGRRGGKESAQFGEFDFIVLSEIRLYLGESKWDNSSERIFDDVLQLRKEQLLRHEIFEFYVREWAFGNYTSWEQFENKAKARLAEKGIRKPIAPVGSRLAANLKTVLRIVKEHFKDMPEIKNILLYFYDGASGKELPEKVVNDFSLVTIDYANESIENYIRIVM